MRTNPNTSCPWVSTIEKSTDPWLNSSIIPFGVQLWIRFGILNMFFLKYVFVIIMRTNPNTSCPWVSTIEKSTDQSNY
jgi:hypothetical protein